VSTIQMQQVLALDRPLAHLLVYLLDKAAEAGHPAAKAGAKSAQGKKR
jgi:hypothetical protein